MSEHYISGLNVNKELTSIIDHLDVAIFIIDESFTIRRLNKSGVRFAVKKSHHEILKKKCYNVIFGKDEVCENCPAKSSENTSNSRFNEKIKFDAEISLLGDDEPIPKLRHFRQTIRSAKNYTNKVILIETLEDIGDTREVLEEKNRNQRLIALGTAVQTVAHELNNPVTGLRLTVESLNALPELPQFVVNKIKMLDNDIKRLDHIISEIRTFNRKASYRFIELNLKSFLTEILKDLRRKSSRAMVYYLDWAKDAPLIIKANNEKLQQVFLNLFQNSLQSFEDSYPDDDGERKLCIWVNATLIDKRRDVNGVMQSYLQLQLIDNSGGMPEEVLQQIFDPFFSTRNRDDYKSVFDMKGGSGLGLFIVHKILEEHGATIEVESVGSYSRFYIFFPLL